MGISPWSTALVARLSSTIGHSSVDDSLIFTPWVAATVMILVAGLNPCSLILRPEGLINIHYELQAQTLRSELPLTDLARGAPSSD